MKELKLIVPDEQAQKFAKELASLMQKHGVKSEDLSSMQPIQERVKTFDDACNILGESHPLVVQYEQIEAAFRGDGDMDDLIAYLQLRIITAALNEGWKPTFDNDEYRYYPWFCYYTEKEIAEMSDDEKEELGLWGAHASGGAHAGLGSVGSHHAWSAASAVCASRLAYKTSDLAKYSGVQFRAIWEKYVGKF